jgi:hypothetical protein
MCLCGGRCAHLVDRKVAKRTGLSHAIFILFPLLFSETSLHNVRSMGSCSLESVSVAPLSAFYWTAAALRRAIGAVVYRRWRCSAQAIRSWIPGLQWSRQGSRRPTRRLWPEHCMMMLHGCSTAAPATSFASPRAEPHARQRVCTARATLLARGERLQSSKQDAWRRLYADLCGRLSIYVFDSSSVCII